MPIGARREGRCSMANKKAAPLTMTLAAPFAAATPAASSPDEGRRINFQVPEKTYQQIRELALKRGVTIRELFLQLLEDQGVWIPADTSDRRGRARRRRRADE